MRSVQFDTIDTWADFDLALTSASIPQPEPKRYFIDVPGGDGQLDFSAAFGGIRFHNRQLDFVFAYGRLNHDWADTEAKLQDFVREIHGKRVEVRPSWIPGWHFRGIAQAEATLLLRDAFSVRVIVDAEPYRLKDELTIVNRTLGSTTLNLELLADRMTVLPEITVSGNTTVAKDDTSAVINAGVTHKLPFTAFSESINLTLSGTSGTTVQIKYRIGAF